MLKNFQYIEIFAISNEGVTIYQKVYSPQNKNISFVVVDNNSNSIIHKFKTYIINNDTLTTLTLNGIKKSGQITLVLNNNKNTFNNSDDYIGIYRIIGWR